MALTLTYSVTGLKVKDQVNSDGDTLTNAVCQTYWKCVGTDDDGNTGEFIGATPFSAETVPSASFVSFADLQEDTVIGWISAVVEADAGYKAHIEEQINRQINTVVETDAAVPWATAEPDASETEAAAE